jgi:protocatechuate 3,4-dioxygenase beta subunit
MSAKTSESRRRFVLKSLALCALPSSSLCANPACLPAVTNILGPAYRKDAPLRSRLCAVDEPGVPLKMLGTISDAQTCKPLAGTLLDVWQVDASGNYDMDSAAYRLRGRIKTDAAGRYAFDTIMPVPYGVRPKHIHYLITRRNYEPRITQCYFAGDDRNGKDPYVKKELIVAAHPPTQGAGASGKLSAVFDVALERERPAEANAAKTYREYTGTYQIAPGVTITVSVVGGKLRWHLSTGENDGDALDGDFMPRAQGRFFVAEYDFEVSFVRNEHGVIDHVLDSRGLLFQKTDSTLR